MKNFAVSQQATVSLNSPENRPLSPLLAPLVVKAHSTHRRKVALLQSASLPHIKKAKLRGELKG